MLPSAGRQGRLAGARWVLALLALAGGAALADPTDGTGPKPRPSSLAPRHTQSHVYGTPVSKPILHKRNKPAHPAPAAQPAAPIK